MDCRGEYGGGGGGFRTQGRVPMNGGLGRSEMNKEGQVPTMHASIQSLSPQTCSAKSKGRAVEG